MKYFFSIVCLLYLLIDLNAQTDRVKSVKNIVDPQSSYDRDSQESTNSETHYSKNPKDIQRSEKLRLKYQNNYEKAKLLAEKSSKPKYFYRGNNLYSLNGIDSFGILQYVTNFNNISAEVIGTNKLYPNEGINVTGSGRILGMWEVGRPLLSHQEFGGRVTQIENTNNVPISEHASHVAGTMIAKGVNSRARGMAYESRLYAYTSDMDIPEMDKAAKELNIKVSNHSYGLSSGWSRDKDNLGNLTTWRWWGYPWISQNEDFKFGLYSDKSRDIDEVAYNNTFYLPVWAAGNDRNNVGPPEGTSHFVRNQNGDWVTSTNDRKNDGWKNGYDCIGTEGCAKNILKVGAVEAEIEGGLISSSMSSFSGWGPTDDGRIKPDVVARGVNVFSCSDKGNNQYDTLQGTSMATPSVSGSIILLHQLFSNNYNSTLRASSMKALILHNAVNDEGPNYREGWGMVDIDKSARCLLDSRVSESRDRILTDTLSIFGPEALAYNFYHDGLSPVKATLVWTDPPGPVTNFSLNSKTLQLEHDLNIRLENTDGTDVYYPWVLDPENPSLPASKGINFRDNIEQIYEENLPPGKYKLTIDYDDDLNESEQTFSLVISGRSNLLTSCNGNISDGSGDKNYENNKVYSWMIAPPDATKITLRFNNFNTEQENDIVSIYDGDHENRTLLGEFSGTTLPPNITSTTGKIFIIFTSDDETNRSGWSASYECENIPPYLTLDKKELLSSSFPFSQTVSIHTNCNWEIKNIPNWITVSKISGSTSAAVDISWTQNNTTSTRVAILEIHGCNGLIETITVTQYGCTAPVVPTITATKSSICIGETATLTVTNPCNDCQYLWSNNSTGTSITVNQGAKYRVTASNTCTSVQSSEVEITTKSLPTKPVTSLVGALKICDESSKTISVNNVCSGCAIKWSTGETTASINVNASGTYHVVYVNECGEGQKSDNIIVEKETYTPTIVVNDLCYLAGPNGGLSYQWQLNGVEITGATLQFYVAKQNGYYTLKAVRSDNCSGISEPKFISGCTSAIEDNIENNIFISPNPFTDEFVIHLSNLWNSRTESNLYSINGQLIKSAKSVGGIIRYDTQDLPKGAYIVKLYVNQQIKQFRIIKI